MVGGSGVFEPFLKAYLENFKFKVVTTDDFKAFFLNYFKDTAAVSEIDWQTWLYAPGKALAGAQQSRLDKPLGLLCADVVVFQMHPDMSSCREAYIHMN